MKYFMSARVTAEICLALLIYTMFQPAGGQLWVLAAFVLAVLACGVIAERFERPVVRLLCCLPAALLIAAAPVLADVIVLAVCWLYAAIRFAVGRFVIEYWAYRREFIALTVCNIAVSLLIAGKAFHIQTSPFAIGFAVASVLLGIFSLRMIRYGMQEKVGWSAYRVLELAVPLGAAVGVSAMLWTLIQGSIYGLQWLAGFIKNPKAPPSQDLRTERIKLPFYSESPDGSGYVEQPLEEVTEPDTKPIEEMAKAVRRLPPYVWLIIILVVLALIALLVVLIVRRKKAAGKAEETGEEEEQISRRGRRGKSTPLTPDRRIRAAYRNYLRYLQQKGQTIKTSDTSEDVLSGGDREVSEEELELRRLYLAARYGVRSAVKDADASRAEALLKTICGEA